MSKDLTDEIDDACEHMFGHKRWEFVSDDSDDSIVVRFFFESKPICNICGDDKHVGFVNDALTFKTCVHCDVDGADFRPKQWPVEVLNEMGLDGDGEPIPDEDEARALDKTHTDIREVSE